MALFLSRAVGQRLVIGDDVVIEIVETRGRNVRLAITAPPEVRVDREETRALRIKDAKRAALAQVHDRR